MELGTEIGVEILTGELLGLELKMVMG